MISFTQQNEQEADRIGIQVLQRSGFESAGDANLPRKITRIRRVTPRVRRKFY